MKRKNAVALKNVLYSKNSVSTKGKVCPFMRTKAMAIPRFPLSHSPPIPAKKRFTR